MRYQTISSVLERCSDELPGFDAVKDEMLVRAWIWDALRALDTEKIGTIVDGSVTVVNGKGQMPADYYMLAGYIASGKPPFTIDRGGQTMRSRQSGKMNFRYYALPLDDNGYPYILDEAEPMVMAYINWQFTVLQQKRMQLSTGYNFRIDMNLNRENERLYKEQMGQLRGNLNYVTPEEVENIRQFMSNYLTYRNPMY